MSLTILDMDPVIPLIWVHTNLSFVRNLVPPVLNAVPRLELPMVRVVDTIKMLWRIHQGVNVGRALAGTSNDILLSS